MTVVILTATVTPNSLKQLRIVDPAERLRQYRLSIKAWSLLPQDVVSQLIVVETSGADGAELLGEVPANRRSNVTVHSYSPSPGEIRLGKGAMEWGAIRHVLTSEPEIESTATIYKATGRLRLANAARIVEPVPETACRVRMMADRSWADTRLMGASRQIWEGTILPASNQVDDEAGSYIERACAAELSYAAALGRTSILRFARKPLFIGASGSNGRRYTSRGGHIVDGPRQLMEAALARVASRKQV